MLSFLSGVARKARQGKFLVALLTSIVLGYSAGKCQAERDNALDPEIVSPQN